MFENADGIEPFKREKDEFYKYLKINKKDIEVNRNELESLNKELFAKAREIGLLEFIAKIYIDSHIKRYVKIIESNIENSTNINSEKLNTTSTELNISSNKVIENKESLNDDYIKNINKYYDSKSWALLINDAKTAEKNNPLFFQNTVMARRYLWALYIEDEDEAFREVERINKIASDKSLLNDTIGLIYSYVGEKTNDLDLLKKSLYCFQSHIYNNKELGLERINKITKIINSVKKEKKLELLGVNSSLIKQISNNEFKKIWKVNYLINSKSDGYVRQYTPMIFIPTNGELTSKGAVAFLKAKSGLLGYNLSEYLKIGEKYPTINDKSKIEIIDFYEITFD
jgi:hypothetical protein